jgi:hypothetical protein
MYYRVRFSLNPLNTLLVALKFWDKQAYDEQVIYIRKFIFQKVNWQVSLSALSNFS